MYAHLTAAGRSKMDDAAPHHVASVRRHLLKPIGNDGAQQLGDLFLIVREHLHALQAV